MRASTPFAVAEIKKVTGKVEIVASAEANGKKIPLVTRHQVGAGAVIVTLVPHLIGQDERAHPSLPYLMNALTTDLLPVEIRLANGARPAGEIMYQVNKTKDGYLVALFNQRGIDKTQNGIARVDRRAVVDVLIRTRSPLKSAVEYTDRRDLSVAKMGDRSEVRLRVPAGDLRVVYLTGK